MKLRICAIAAIAGLLFANTSHAQDDIRQKQKVDVGWKKRMVSIGNEGIRMEAVDSVGKEIKEDRQTSRWKATFAMFDLGVNMLNDKTVYTDPSAVNYLNVPAAMRNKELFDLKPSKSINTNIYPLMVKFRALRTHNQRLFIATGIGLQVYNFRYEDNLTYSKNPNSIILDSTQFKKDKLAVNYLSVPLMVTGKTRLHRSNWLVYGAGITAGYRLTSWNKQVSHQFGKVKTHGNFDLMDYNSCLTAEFGVEGILRFYASYQLTSLYDNGLNQRPICIGLRFGGI